MVVKARVLGYSITGSNGYKHLFQNHPWRSTADLLQSNGHTVRGISILLHIKRGKKLTSRERGRP
jgi:hypothetical protein